MYTLDTKTLLTLGATEKESLPNWFNAERYYNCEDFLSILYPTKKHEKKMRKIRR